MFHQRRYWNSKNHPKGDNMANQIFVNLPVKHLNRSVEFFTKLGFSFNQQFTDETATCMIVTGDIYVMLLTEEKFKTFTLNAVCDAKNTPKYLCAYLSKAAQKSMRWFAKQSQSAPLLTINHRTMVLCTGMDFRIWMVIFGNSSIWSQVR